LRTALTILTLVVLLGVAGCTSSGRKASKEKGNILTVDFEQGKTLQYKFVTRREVSIEWDPEKKMSKAGGKASENIIESLDIVMAYTPTEVDPLGLTTIEATCKSAKVTRSKGPSGSGGKDAVEYFAGKSFTLKVGPTGKIEDYSQLDALIKEVGEKAFRPGADRGRTKEPDMICDFIGTQWFLWDSVSSIDTAAGGLSPGQTWKSQLSVPAPMVMRKARDVAYKLDEIRPSEKGPVAVISSSYSPAETVPASWPIPYSGTFQVSGTFGFLSGYRFLSLQGSGQELFNIEAGQSEQYNQQYEMKIQAAIPMGISVQPLVTIKQSITAKLL
jgi:hypothetical protein